MASGCRFLAICGRWVLPIDRPPVEDGSVIVGGGKIQAVGRWARLRHDLPVGCRVWDFADSVILPAFVNAHVHLELSDCDHPFVAEDRSFACWIKMVISHRQARGGYLPEVVRQGLKESLRLGTSAVGDMAHELCHPEDYLVDLPEEEVLTVQPHFEVGTEWETCAKRGSANSSPEKRDSGGFFRLKAKGVVFAEIIAPLMETSGQALKKAVNFLQQGWEEGLTPGLAPHAPYSVHPTTLAQIVKLARERNLPVTFHLAESREECELLTSGTGPLRAFLEERQVWTPELVGGKSFAEYLRILAEAPRGLVVHGNFLSLEEYRWIARQRHLYLVHCPRSYQHFRWGEFPLKELLRWGCRVAIGTDGRSSVRDLNMAAELSTLIRNHPSIPPLELLRLVTWGSAEALGLAEHLGTITPGKDADLVIYRLNISGGKDPLSFLEIGSPLPAAVIRDGLLVFAAD